VGGGRGNRCFASREGNARRLPSKTQRNAGLHFYSHMCLLEFVLHEAWSIYRLHGKNNSALS
jgi:hypothetical protein